MMTEISHNIRLLHQKIKWVSLIPYLLISLGIIIRIWGYDASSIRYDEALSLYRSTESFTKFLGDHQYYSSLFLWELLLRIILFENHSLWLLRLPALIFGIGTIFISYKLTQVMKFNLLQTCLTILVISVAPGLIWVSQDARAYGLLIFTYLVAIYFVETNKPLGLTAIVGLTAYIHAIGPAFGGAALIYYSAIHPDKLKKSLVIMGVSVASWIPWYILFFSIKTTPGFIKLFWLGKINPLEFSQQIYKTFFLNYPNSLSLIGFLLILIIILILVTLNSIALKNKKSLVFILPFGIILIESLFWQNVFFYRTGLTLIIPFAIFVGSSIFRNGISKRDITIALICVCISIAGLVGWNPRTKGGDVNRVSSHINQAWKDGDILYYGTATVGLPFHYYLDGKPEYIIDGITNENLTPPTVDTFEARPLNTIPHERVWLIYPDDSFLPPAQRKTLDSYAKEGELLFRITIFEIPDIFVVLIE